MEFTYDAAWIASDRARPLSLSLPINFDGLPIRGESVGYFFDNLLPDSEPIRQRIRSRFGTRSADAFDLLAAIGRDCVGAIQLLPEDETPTGVFDIATKPLDELAIERALLGTLSAASGVARDDDEDFRISLAGAQEKTALTWHRDRWCSPAGATPTTHIFKLPLGLVGGRRLDMTHSLENEWLCSRLLSAYGVPIAACEVQTFGATKALVVERFDRLLHPSRRYWLRLPQEDFCQATGTPSSAKYEVDGGPGLLTLANVLQASDTRDEDLRTLLQAQVLFWMLAATDGHAKNFSLRLLPQGRFRLTPLYDVLSAWPVAGTGAQQLHPTKLKLAMSLRGKHKHYHLHEIERRHFNAAAQHCKYHTDMEDILEAVIAATPGVIEQVGGQLPSGFPAELFDVIAGGLRNAAEKLGC
jgi:serine/threonine-protein kinase HipA